MDSSAIKGFFFVNIFFAAGGVVSPSSGSVAQDQLNVAFQGALSEI